MRPERLGVVGMLALMFVAAPAPAQDLLYNPTYIEFDQTLEDGYNLTQTYRLEVWAYPADVATQQPLLTDDVSREKATFVAGTRYRIQLAEFASLPAGTSYTFRLSAVGSGGSVSQPSDLTPGYARWTYCEAAPLYIRPMTAEVTLAPEYAVGAMGQVTVTIDSPQPVHRVVVDFMGDGQPAHYFYQAADLRGAHKYAVGPFLHAGSFRAIVDAVDEQGCSVQVAPGVAVVR